MSVIIIGAGAAGLVAAGFASQHIDQVVIIERNPRPARKVLITGKGRCNLTNNCLLDTLIANVPRNGRFLYSAFSGFMPQDMMELIESLHVPLKTERGNRVFPVSDKAMDIVDALTKFGTQKAHVVQGRAMRLMMENGAVKGVELQNGQRYEADSVILSTGGMSYPATGSTGDGYALAKQAGHSVTELTPSLVPLNVSGEHCAELQGLSLKNISVEVTDKQSGKCVYHEFGELMFTHFGLSGPVILSASAHMKNMSDGKYEVSIDLKPALSKEQLDSRLQRDFEKYSNRDFANSLGDLLPQKLIPVIIALADIPHDLKTNQITKQMRQNLVDLFKALTFPVSGFRPIDEAIVTSGGVSIKEIDPSTMQSKLCKGLYFAGEIIDVDAYTGGFNLQIAFSTGALAGKSV